MWRWLRLLTGWHMRDWLAYFSSLPLSAAPQVRSFSIGWRKKGLDMEGTPVLATADEVFVRTELRYSASKSAKKSELSLRTSRQSFPADSLIQVGTVGNHSVYRAEFRLEPLPANDTFELLWQGQLLHQVSVPVLSVSQFVEQLRLIQPTVFVVLRSADQNSEFTEYCVACTKFPRAQGRYLLASAEFTSPTWLVGLLECQPTVIFRELATGQAWEVPIRLSADQLRARQALVTIPCPSRPRRTGRWHVEWRLLTKPLHSCQLEVCTMRSLNPVYHKIVLEDAYFVLYDDKSNQVTIEKRLPKHLGAGRLGPCFLLRSAEPGLVFFADVEVYASSASGLGPRLLAREAILLTDAPTIYVPGTLSVADLRHVVGFELHSKGHVIGHLPLSEVPCAKFNSEGAFYGAPDNLAWSFALDEELRERLKRLMDQH